MSSTFVQAGKAGRTGTLRVVQDRSRPRAARSHGLAGCFTVSAATAVPVVTGVQPAAGFRPPPPEPMGVSEKYFVRRVHVAAARPPAGGVRAAAAPAPAVVTVTQQASQPAAPAPVAAPRPVATTGGTPPK